MDQLTLHIYKDGLTKGIQISISKNGLGYRLSGPEYSGNSIPLATHVITREDADEIRKRLDAEFPTTERSIKFIKQDANRYQFLRSNSLSELLDLYTTDDTSDVGLDYIIDEAIKAGKGDIVTQYE